MLDNVFRSLFGGPGGENLQNQTKTSTFFDNHGFDDPQSECEDIFPKAGGVMLRKRLHPSPPLYSIDPASNIQYNESLQGAKLACELNIEHLSPVQQCTLQDLIKMFWPVLMNVVLSNMPIIIDTESTQGLTPHCV